MPLPHDTAVALGVERDGVNFGHCQSRSLMLDRLANPALEKDDRRDFFLNTFKKTSVRDRIPAWQSFLRLQLGLSTDVILFAQLQSRLMVNMAGGVMENAGLCLDRFGVPYIPGSAVKGCARRMAIQNLLEACEANEPTDKLARLLADIALVFGWGEGDWKQRADFPSNDDWVKKRSDFAYACGHAFWPKIRAEVRQRLCAELKCKEVPSHFAASVSFLPAYPHQLPANDLELDVLTCHHPKYYRGDEDMPVALDTEEPNPVVFPAVSPGKGTEQDRCVFALAVLPLRGEHDSLSQPGKEQHLLTREWLRQGLETFGIGAKTSGGYGWFDTSEKLQAEIKHRIQEEEQRRTDERRRRDDEAKRKAEEENRRRQRAELAKATEGMTPEQKALYEMRPWPEQKFKDLLQKLPSLPSEQKAAAYQLLRTEKIAIWQQIKHLANEGKQKERQRWSPAAQELYKMAKERKEKMP